jgi:phosphotransferase system HPr (HPr) family protein
VAETVVTITGKGGLHLRAAARFVQVAARFTSAIHLRSLARADAQLIDGKSMLGLLQSGIAQGQSVWLSAEGPDADAALAALCLLVERGFEEPSW